MGGGRWECWFWTFILWKKVRIDYFFLMIACVRERLCERWILTRRCVINRLAPPLCFSSNAKIIQYGDQRSHHKWNGLHRRHTLSVFLCQSIRRYSVLLTLIPIIELILILIGTNSSFGRSKRICSRRDTRTVVFSKLAPCNFGLCPKPLIQTGSSSLQIIPIETSGFMTHSMRNAQTIVICDNSVTKPLK